jgi:hypothetical protein
MIAYEELCDALARWRERNGLANGPSATMPKGPVRVPTPPTFEAAQTEEMHVGQDTTIAPNPLAALPYVDGEDPTALHVPAPVRTGDSTGEIEDSMFVDDEA